MKKKFLAVITAMMIVFAFSSCGTPRSIDCVSDNRFLVVTDNIEGTGGNEIFADRETGVMYFYHQSGYAGGLTVMLDKDGKPLIWEDD